MSDGGGPVIACFHDPIDRDPSGLNVVATKLTVVGFVIRIYNASRVAI